MNGNRLFCVWYGRFRAFFAFFLLGCLLCSCWECPSYSRADFMARRLMIIPKTSDGAKRKLQEINRDLLLDGERFGVPPGVCVEPERMKVTMVEDKKTSGFAMMRVFCWTNNGLPCETLHERINIDEKEVHRDDHMSDNFLGLLSEKEFELWYDMDFNQTLVHELAHHYFGQRYPYLWDTYDKRTKNVAWKIIEGHANYVAFNWINRHYGYSKRILRLRSLDSYQEAYQYFMDWFTDDHGKVIWDALDRAELSLAPPGYRVRPLKAVYPE